MTTIVPLFSNPKNNSPQSSFYTAPLTVCVSNELRGWGVKAALKHGNSSVAKISRISKSGFPHMGIRLVDSAVGFQDSATYLLNNRGLFFVVTFIVVFVSTVLNF